MRSDITHSVVFCWLVCSTHSYIPFSAGSGVFFLGAPSATAVNKDCDVERSILNPPEPLLPNHTIIIKKREL